MVFVGANLGKPAVFFPFFPLKSSPNGLARRLGVRGDTLALGIGAKGAALNGGDDDEVAARMVGSPRFAMVHQPRKVKD